MTLRATTRGELLRARRRALGETQTQFASRCGLAREQIARAEAGRRSLSLTASMLVAHRLGITVDELTYLPPELIPNGHAGPTALRPAPAGAA